MKSSYFTKEEPISWNTKFLKNTIRYSILKIFLCIYSGPVDKFVMNFSGNLSSIIFLFLSITRTLVELVHSAVYLVTWYFQRIRTSFSLYSTIFILSECFYTVPYLDSNCWGWRFSCLLNTTKKSRQVTFPRCYIS